MAKTSGGVKPTDNLRRVTIRIPTDLYDALWRKREQTGKSLNDLLIAAIANLVGTAAPQVKKGVPGPKPKRTKP